MKGQQLWLNPVHNPALPLPLAESEDGALDTPGEAPEPSAGDSKDEGGGSEGTDIDVKNMIRQPGLSGLPHSTRAPARFSEASFIKVLI